MDKVDKKSTLANDGLTSGSERGQKEKTTSSSPFFWCCMCNGGRNQFLEREAPTSL